MNNLFETQLKLPPPNKKTKKTPKLPIAEFYFQIDKRKKALFLMPFVYCFGWANHKLGNC